MYVCSADAEHESLHKTTEFGLLLDLEPPALSSCESYKKGLMTLCFYLPAKH